MRNNCAVCKGKLNKKTASPCVLEKGSGMCRKCSSADCFAKRLKNPTIHIWYRIRGGAKKRGIRCSLKLTDIPSIPEFCPVFTWMRLTYRVGKGLTGNSPSLDRINPKQGYTKGNIRIISHRANMLKRDATDRELAALGRDAQSRLKITLDTNDYLR